MNENEAVEVAKSVLKAAQSGDLVHVADYFDYHELQYDDWLQLCEDYPECRRYHMLARHAIGRGIIRRGFDKNCSKMHYDLMRFNMDDFTDWQMGQFSREAQIKSESESLASRERMQQLHLSLQKAKEDL